MMNHSGTDTRTERADYTNYASKINEIKITSLNDADEYLHSKFQVFGIPVRIVNDVPYIVLIRRAE
jgi:hypothetical protein